METTHHVQMNVVYRMGITQHVQMVMVLMVETTVQMI